MRTGAIKGSILVVFWLVSMGLTAQNSSEQTYISVSNNIANPERGWYDDHYNFGSYLSGSYTPLDSTFLRSLREEEQITLILRIFYLHQFLDENNVSAEYLAKMKADFEAVRAAGIKCIVRFSYSDSQNAEHWDATPDKVLSHIESLRGVVSANSDVILAVQAGFIGAWGEWYYTNNFAGNGYVPDEEDQNNRRAVVNALLDILPAHVQLQVRTPAIKQAMVESEKSISKDEAYSGTKLSRVAHHNDCFLANGTDYGTYTQLSEDLAYLAQDTKYAIAGGETCDASNSYSDCEAGMPRMRLLHWTYLNRDYNRDVYEKWEDQGCYDSVTILLGYRLSLESSVMTRKAEPGDSVDMDLVFRNKGFAAPTQYKPMQLVLRKKHGNPLYIDLAGENTDIRFWQPGDTQLSISAKLDDTLSPGNYEAGLRFPDRSETLSANPAYSIRLANLGMWDDSLGVNWLNQFITVGAADTLLVPDRPTNLTAQNISDTQIDLNWQDRSSGEIAFEIYRSENSTDNWVLHAIVDSNSMAYSDLMVGPGNQYRYMIRARGAEVNSAWSDWAEASIAPSALVDIEDRGIAMYPNPLRGNSLYFEGDIRTNMRIALYDSQGSKVFENEYNALPEEISLPELSRGLYIIRFSTDDSSILGRLIVD